MADQNLLKEIQSNLEKKPLKENLRYLFCETLHWGHPRGLTSQPVTIDAPQSRHLTATPVAQLSGLPVFSIDWPEDRTPTVTTRRALHRDLASAYAEHLICYITQDQRQIAFTWARKRPDGKTELRTMPYEVGSPARTTIERLGELAFTLDELGPTGQPPITALTDKLNRAFDVEAVTKKFYQEIANWYFWARDYVTFPIPKGEKNTDAYIAQNLIRLITRMIFCWFMKAKGLIPDDLFNPHQLAGLLKNGHKLSTSKETTFYKAILQNLFFATLNQEMDKRAFRKRNKDPRGRDPHRGITNLYRYEDYFTDPKTFLQLIASIPFLNGGLFECLDKVYRVEENLPDVRIDGFSDHSKNPLSVPDFLFFGEERTVDLSEAYGEKRYKRAAVRGLTHTFYHYNFTVTEATPLEQEVALDPELSGKVFENLLAAYNPETATTARKATGSYYTPREIVNYMVDEALLAYLTTKLTSDSPSNGSNDSVTSEVEKRLRHLFADNEEPHQFNSIEVKVLIDAIDNLKALDPACGSGAFPMGLLHKLVFILGKLDPDNEQWKERQIARVREAVSVAERIEDTTIRERTLKDLERQIAIIEDAFARNELDYGRKLYLIENCIYGVDIQPIAVQIAKMRFFISLLVDQKINPHSLNLGILPLPNLETKFVAANTLIGIEKPAQQTLRNPEIDSKEAELERIRERHFTARTPATKAKYRELDAKLRAEISKLLQKDGFPRETTEKLANWDPYDQNATADFFDPEWMFGIREGFDIVIGNPPYIRIQTLIANEPEAVEYYKRRYLSARKGNYDLYVVFVERSLELLQPNGQFAFILPHKFFNAEYGEQLRELIAKGKHLRHIVHFGDQQVFPGTTNYVCLLFLSKSRSGACRFVRVESLSEWLISLQGTEGIIPSTRVTAAEWNFVVGKSANLFEKLQQMPVKLGDVADIFVGLQTSADDVFIMNFVSETLRTITLESKSLKGHWTFEKELLYPLVSGTDISPYGVLPRRQFILFPYRVTNEQAELISLRELSISWPRLAEYLKKNRQRLEGREKGKFKGNEWHRFGRSQNLGIQQRKKLCVPRLVEELHAAPDFDGTHFLDNVDVGGVTFSDRETAHSLAYLLVLLNSRLMRWFFPHVSAPFRGGWRSANRQFISLVPFRPINFGVSAERSEHNALVKLVERILAAKRVDPSADTSAWEKEIDERIYRLYGLTDEEIKIVEESVRR